MALAVAPGARAEANRDAGQPAVQLLKPKCRQAGQLVWVGQLALVPAHPVRRLVSSSGAEYPGIDTSSAIAGVRDDVDNYDASLSGPPLDEYDDKETCRQVLDAGSVRASLADFMDMGANSLLENSFDQAQDESVEVHAKRKARATASSTKATRHSKQWLRDHHNEHGGAVYEREDVEDFSASSAQKHRMSPIARRGTDSPRVLEHSYGTVWRPGGVGTGLTVREPVLFNDPYVDPWERQQQARGSLSRSPQRDKTQQEKTAEDCTHQEPWLVAGRSTGTDYMPAEVAGQIAHSREQGRERAKALKQRHDASVQRYRRERERLPRASKFTIFLREKQKEAASRRSVELPSPSPSIILPNEFLKDGFGFLELAGSGRRPAVPADSPHPSVAPKVAATDVADV